MDGGFFVTAKGSLCLTICTLVCSIKCMDITIPALLGTKPVIYRAFVAGVLDNSTIWAIYVPDEKRIELKKESVTRALNGDNAYNRRGRGDQLTDVLRATDSPIPLGVTYRTVRFGDSEVTSTAEWYDLNITEALIDYTGDSPIHPRAMRSRQFSFLVDKLRDYEKTLIVETARRSAPETKQMALDLLSALSTAGGALSKNGVHAAISEDKQPMLDYVLDELVKRQRITVSGDVIRESMDWWG